jgi:hypothetical protein
MMRVWCRMLRHRLRGFDRLFEPCWTVDESDNGCITRSMLYSRSTYPSRLGLLLRHLLAETKACDWTLQSLNSSDGQLWETSLDQERHLHGDGVRKFDTSINRRITWRSHQDSLYSNLTVIAMHSIFDAGIYVALRTPLKPHISRCALSTQLEDVVG